MPALPIWFFQGEVLINPGDWETMPKYSVNQGTLRVTFRTLDGSPIDGQWSFVYLRRVWVSFFPYNAEQAIVVYPSATPQILSLPLPPSKDLLGLSLAKFQVKMGWKAKTPAWKEESIYSFALEEI